MDLVVLLVLVLVVLVLVPNPEAACPLPFDILSLEFLTYIFSILLFIKQNYSRLIFIFAIENCVTK